VIILDYCSGVDLENTYWKDANPKYPGGVVDKTNLLDWIIQMAEAISYLHTELYMVHRDLHWGNWMI
jgi:serine/threonine protein kinase